MVVFVDLDRDAFSEHHRSALALGKPVPPELMVAPVARVESAEFPPSPTSSEDDRDADAIVSPLKNAKSRNPNRRAFSAALSCYPYVCLF